MSYPFTAVVGADDMALALVLTAISPQVGGVLVRGEKGTAKSTMVRALVELLPDQQVIDGCRFGCDPSHPDPTCPDGPHDAAATFRPRPARLVELPVGASEDRVVGSLDLGKALGDGVATFSPGLLAAAHRGLLYVDEVNLLHDHLVDLLLDAAAMGRSSVERDGVSFSHAARFVLVGTMNPEEGELRPQLLDRFGLTVEVVASRDPDERAEVVRRRLAYDLDPDGFVARFADHQQALGDRIADAQAKVDSVLLTDRALVAIARVCAGFDVDGMRADIVTARAARAHAAWCGRDEVTREDIRVAARFALPHRRRRKPFDAPGLDEDRLDELLDDFDDPEPPTDPTDPDPSDPEPSDPEPSDAEPTDQGPDDAGEPHGPDDAQPNPQTQDTPEPQPTEPSRSEAAEQQPNEPESSALPAPVGVAGADDPFRAITLRARGIGSGAPGRRSRAITSSGRRVGSALPNPGEHATLHLPATLRAAAPWQATRREPGQTRVRFARSDLRTAVLEGPEANLVVFCVDASGSMAARNRMSAVKSAVLSLLMDAYQRRDRVAVVTFRGTEAEVALPPTSSVEAAAACLAELPHGGRTPLAEGLERTAALLAVEKVRDPHQRPLVLVLTDGRATAGKDALPRARAIAGAWTAGLAGRADTIVVDCENGRFRMGLAPELAGRMSARCLSLASIDAEALVETVKAARPSTSSRRSAA